VSAADEGCGEAGVRLCVADGQRTFVEALALRLDAEADLSVVATVAGPDALLPTLRAHPVDVALLAVEGPRSPFLGLAEAISAERPEIRLVALAEAPDVPVLARAVRLGFRGWVPKDADVATLVAAVRGVVDGGTHLPPRLLTDLLPHLLHEQEERRESERLLTVLTTREREVLVALSAGADRQGIADELGISSNTVRTHTQAVLKKLGVHSSLAAVALARRAGLC
jgi:DNA-binding NarL/FixJ family response regulator